MSNTYDILLNPPPSKQQKPAEKKADISEPVKQQPHIEEKKLASNKKSKLTRPPKPRTSSINQPINSFINQPNNRLMNKPTGFYITEQLDNRLDQAVEYFRKQHGLKKVDRSIVLNALLERDELWADSSLNQLINQLIRLLTIRLMG